MFHRRLEAVSWGEGNWPGWREAAGQGNGPVCKLRECLDLNLPCCSLSSEGMKINLSKTRPSSFALCVCGWLVVCWYACCIAVAFFPLHPPTSPTPIGQGSGKEVYSHLSFAYTFELPAEAFLKLLMPESQSRMIKSRFLEVGQKNF